MFVRAPRPFLREKLLFCWSERRPVQPCDSDLRRRWVFINRCNNNTYSRFHGYLVNGVAWHVLIWSFAGNCDGSSLRKVQNVEANSTARCQEGDGWVRSSDEAG